MLLRIAAVAASFVLAGCNRKPDPLAEHRASCEALQKAGQLRKGLAVEACAQQLKVAADAADPQLRAREILDRLASLTAQGRGQSGDQSQISAVRDAAIGLQQLGKPVVAVSLERMAASQDPDFRIAIARALVGLCSEDCATGDYSCIVPALLEGVSADKPSEVRHEAAKGLTRCTGQAHGDDLAAWKKWWSERPPAGASTAQR